jgi:hypothetical protein
MRTLDPEGRAQLMDLPADWAAGPMLTATPLQEPDGTATRLLS